MVVVPGPERGEKSKRTTAAQPAAATPGRSTRGASRRSLDKEPGKKVDKSKGAGRYQERDSSRSSSDTSVDMGPRRTRQQGKRIREEPVTAAGMRI